MDVGNDARVAELESDAAELRRLLGEAKREGVQKELQRVLTKIEGELRQAKKAAEPAKPAPEGYVPLAEGASASKPKPVEVSVKAAGPWTEITTFGLDLGGYDKPHVVVDVRLKGVESIPVANVQCDFTESSFDLKVIGLDGANLRMLKTNLEKDIVPSDSSVRVKKNHVLVTLAKVKGQYGYDSWADLVAKGRRKPTSAKTENPQDSIMDMMKDLYDDGDDNMKKVIGEAMYKSKRGEKYDPKDSDMKMAGMGLDDM